jgi:hypothetical protein
VDVVPEYVETYVRRLRRLRVEVEPLVNAPDDTGSKSREEPC